MRLLNAARQACASGLNVATAAAEMFRAGPAASDLDRAIPAGTPEPVALQRALDLRR